MRNIYIMIVLAILGVVSIVGCKEKDKPIMDAELYGYWRLDSISNTNGGGVTITKENFDTIPFFEGASIIVKFSDDFNISSEYNGIMGFGDYTLMENKQIAINSFFRGDEMGMNSIWFDRAKDALNSAQSYSITNFKLSIFHEEGSRQMHFTKL